MTRLWIIICLQRLQYIFVGCTTLETILWKIGAGIMWTKYSDVSKVCHYVEFLPSKSEVPGEKTPSKWCFLAITSWCGLGPKGIDACLVFRGYLVFCLDKVECVMFMVALGLPQKLSALVQRQLIEHMLYRWKQCGTLRRNGRGVVTSSSWYMSTFFCFHTYLLLLKSM